MRKVFPFSFKGKNFKAVIFSTLIYTLFIVLSAVLVSLLHFIKLPEAVYTVFHIIRQIVLLYSASGIVVAILNACDLLDRKWFE